MKGLSPQGTVPEFSYTYDSVGNRKSMVTQAGTHTYSYDKTYQLKAVDYPQASAFPSTTFNYDTLGNRASVVDSVTTNYTQNNLNQYTKVGTTDYTYDSNGNLIQGLSPQGTVPELSYAYDYENRLTLATKPGTTATYKYDPFGRRIEKSVNGSTTKFLYDGDQLIAEYDGSGTLTKKFIYGPGIDEIVKGLSPQGTVPEWYYHFDGLGSVTSLTNSSGTTIESYSYDVFGKPLIKDASGNTVTASSIGNSFLFTGREVDSETGLYYYRARYYSPELGRFLQRDPVGYASGMNLYAYCLNAPTNWVDPLGLWGIKFGDFNIGVGKPTFEFNSSSWGYLSKTLAATADGFIPFADPFKTSYTSRGKCPGNEDIGLGLSRYYGAVARNALIGAGVSGLFSSGTRTIAWSGEWAREAALAGKGAGMMLEDTIGGHLLNVLQDVSIALTGKRLPYIIWQVASGIFAANASGTVQAFVTNASSKGIFATIEAPIIEFLQNAKILFR